MKRVVCFALSVISISCALAGSPVAEAPFRTMDGAVTTLQQSYPGKVVMIVNVASRCGNTPQYTGLEKIYRHYSDRGFVVLAFPCNDFGNQEPGSLAEIKQFCTSKYGVTFPIMDKLNVKGPDQSPLYAALTGKGAKFPGDVKWNFGKFLVNRKGVVVARFEPRTEPDIPEVTAAIEAALSAQ